MKILITGAHFTPAQAVIEELQKVGGSEDKQSLRPDGLRRIRESDKNSIFTGARERLGDDQIEIVYVGRKYTQEGDSTLSVESQVLPKLGVKFIPIVAGRLRRLVEFGTIVSFFKIPIGFVQSFFYVLKEQPDVVLSFGGYVAVGSVFSAWLLNIPVIIHEQTLVTGLANRFSNLFASKIAVTFDKEYSFNKNKMILTGNPMRKELVGKGPEGPNGPEGPEVIELLKIQWKEKLPLIYITGGNQGSVIINNAVSPSLDELTQKAVVVHQTGDSKYNEYEKQVEIRKGLKFKERYLVQKWFDAKEVAVIFRNADLVISRAGANTLLELAYFGIPTIVIPLPYLSNDEQNVNAKFFEKLGLVQILSQKSLSPEKLEALILESLKSLTRLKKEAEGCRSVVILDAEKKLALETILLATRVKGMG